MLSKKSSLIGLLLFVGCLSSFEHLQSNIIGLFIRKAFPHHLATLSKEQWQEIEGVFHEMSLDLNNYPVIQTNNYGCAAALGSTVLVLETAFFTDHDEKERRAILGHEAGHILNNHMSRGLIQTFILIGILGNTYETLMEKLLKLFEKDSNILSDAENKQTIISASMLFILPFFMVPLIGTIMRHHEKEADLDSAQRLKSTSGLLSFFESIKDGTIHKQPPRPPLSLMRLHSSLISHITRYVPFHPSIDERIAYVKEEENIQKMLDDLIPELEV